jgi:ABC-2 type transport system permease protein/sodium transport system permease protein
VDPSSQPLGPLAPGRLLRLARKELTEILRDRRTIFTLVLMPLLLYPLLTIGFGQFVFSGKVAEQVPIYRLGFASPEEQVAAMAYLSGGHAGEGNQPQLQPFIIEDLEGGVREKLIDVGFRARQRPVALDQNAEWDLVYRDDSAYARDAIRYLNLLSARADSALLRAGLKDHGMRVRPPVRLRPEPLTVESRDGLSVAVFVPLVLILMTMTGAVYPAIDLTAGERERGTLEVLLAAPVPRVSLLFGKYVAVVAVAVLTALVNLGSMTVSLLVSGMAERVFGPAGLRVVTLLEVFGLVLLFAAFFAAVLLVLTSFARSFKEAQAYLIPLMVVALVPGIVGLLPGLRLTGALAVVPLLNIVLLARDLLEGQGDPVSAVVVVIVTLAYAVLAVALAAQVFGAEGVLYGETGGWRALLRRKK